MAFMLHFDHENRVIYHKVSGVMNQSQLEEANQHIARDTTCMDYSMILDFSAVRHFDLPEHTLEKLGRRIRQEIPVRLRALVVNDRALEGAEAFAAHAANAFCTTRVFTCLGDACQWLLISEDDLLRKCRGYRPADTFYGSNADHWQYV